MSTRKYYNTILIAVLVLPLCGCHSAGGWNKMAFAHRRAFFQPPKGIYTDFVRRTGQERFADAMARMAHRPHHFYAIGWFGNLWHLDVVARHLDAKDEATRRMALGAFNRLANEDFASGRDAIGWWSSHSKDFPRWKRGKKAK